MRKHLPAILVVLLGAALPAFAQSGGPPDASVPAGSSIVANVTYCSDEAEANNVLRAHRAGGLSAGIDYIVHSPACKVGTRNFTVLRQLAAYPDLPLEQGQAAKTFYVIEAVDPVGERMFIVSMVKVTDRFAEKS